LSPSASDDPRSPFTVAHSSRGDSEGSSTAEFHADLAATVTDQRLIGHAVGVLMFVYDLDADNAVEMLRWGSRALDVTIRVLARRLTEDVVGRARNGEVLPRCERVDLRSTCDDVLFTPRTGQTGVSARPQTVSDHDRCGQ
jgi:hypothetical protein